MAGLWIVVVFVLLLVGYCLLVGLGAIQFGPWLVVVLVGMIVALCLLTGWRVLPVFINFLWVWYLLVVCCGVLCLWFVSDCFW